MNLPTHFEVIDGIVSDLLKSFDHLRRSPSRLVYRSSLPTCCLLLLDRLTLRFEDAELRATREMRRAQSSNKH